MTVSAIVPTWNGSKTISACIASLQKQALRFNEIIVVDNGSTDGTENIISRQFPKVRLMRLAKNTGVSGGRNTGIDIASKRSGYIFIFDHDMVADDQMLAEMVKTANRRSADIVTPKIYYQKPKNFIWSAGTDVNLWTGQVLFRNGLDVGQFESEEAVQVAPAAMLLSRRLLNKIGVFDEQIFASWEDTDLCFRAAKTGFKIYYSPRAIAYHAISINPRDEAKRLLTRYPFQIGQNRIIFMKRFGRSWIIFLFFLPVYIVYYGLLALKYWQFSGYWLFIKGTVSGLVKSVKIHTYAKKSV